MRSIRSALLLLLVQALSIVAAAKSCTPSHAVYGLIGDRWRALNGSDGPLGCPTSEEMDHPEGRGRYQTFEYGSVSWSPNTGDRSVQAAYLAQDGITVEWGDTAPFHYDVFLVRWDKDGVNMGQKDIGSGSGGKWTIPFSGLGRYRIVVEGCDTHFLASSTCRQGWSNPIYVTFTGAPLHGNAPQSAPFDLIAQGADPVGNPLNPLWGAQVNNPGSIPNADAACFDLNYGNLVPRFDRCTTQKTYRDTVNGPHAITCTPGASSPIHGHVNWWVATYTGTISWKSHEWPDDDYNLLLSTPQNAVVTWDNDPQILKLEFDSDETIDNFQTPWWSQFRAAVDQSDAAAHQMLDGKQAIATGLVGLDCVHKCASELHPLFAIAINTSSTDQEDVWAMFVRNWGNEGWCSEYRHLFQQSDFVFRIPWRQGAVSVTVLDQNGASKFLTNDNRVSGPNVTWAVNEGVDVAFHLPAPDAEPRINGELHLRWTIPGRIDPNRMRVTQQATRPKGIVTARGLQNTKAEREPGEEQLHRLIDRLTPTQKQGLRATRLASAKVDVATAKLNVSNARHLATVPSIRIPRIDVKPDVLKAARDEKRRQMLCAAYANRPPGFEAMCGAPINPATRPQIKRVPPPPVVRPKVPPK